jgi:glucans biosynthesis protein C
LMHDNPARRYLTTAIFPVYILHQTVIVMMAHALKPSHLYPPVEGVLLVLATVAACFLGYEALRRVRLLRPLFGLERVPNAPNERSARRSAPAVERLSPRSSGSPELGVGVPQDIN